MALLLLLLLRLFARDKRLMSCHGRGVARQEKYAVSRVAYGRQYRHFRQTQVSRVNITGLYMTIE
jgi:hypothetical protein